MSSSGKLVLCLAVIFCTMQMISARPRTDEMFLDRVKNELVKKCEGLEKDMGKEMNNIMHKLEKESIKLTKKAVKKDSQECVEAARLQAEEELEEKNQEIEDCIAELKETLESTLTPEASVSEVMSFRQDFKNKLQICKKMGKADIKNVQNQFSIAGKRCFL